VELGQHPEAPFRVVEDPRVLCLGVAQGLGQRQLGLMGQSAAHPPAPGGRAPVRVEVAVVADGAKDAQRLVGLTQPGQPGEQRGLGARELVAPVLGLHPPQNRQRPARLSQREIAGDGPERTLVVAGIDGRGDEPLEGVDGPVERGALLVLGEPGGLVAEVPGLERGAPASALLLEPEGLLLGRRAIAQVSIGVVGDAPEAAQTRLAEPPLPLLLLGVVQVHRQGVAGVPSGVVVGKR
jgi:hypothetical protein